MNRIIRIVLLQLLVVIVSVVVMLVWSKPIGSVVYMIGFTLVFLPYILQSNRLNKRTGAPDSSAPTSPASSPKHQNLPLSTDLENSIRIIAEHNKLEAIKKVREITSANLKEATASVEVLANRPSH